MSLDKQKILNELGSVVNQLQGADCGCMGKIFSNCTHQNNSGNTPYGGGHGSCGHHCHGHHHQGWGQNAPCGGEPHSNQPYMYAGSPQMNAGNTQMHAGNPQMHAGNPQMHAGNPQKLAGNQQMNACNPQQLYADTYKYLNQNLMQPVLREVYNDLKSITPANTIANNAMANQLGLAGNASPEAKGNMNSPMAHSQMGGGEMNNQMTSGGMGSMTHNQMTAGGMNHNMPQHQITAGGMNNMPYNHMTGGGNNMSYNHMTGGGNNMSYNQTTTGGMNNMPQSQANSGGMSNMTPQNQMYGSNGGSMYGNAQGNTIAGHMSQNMTPTHQTGNMGANPMHQQMAPQHHNQPKHGPQGAGMFNSMFPGVMQGFGGDLDFDPMAIAVQMNPSNQQRAAMDSMNKMMMSNKEGIGKILTETGDSAAMQPAIKGANAAAAALSPNQPPQMQQNTAAYQAASMQQNAPTGYQQMQQNTPTAYQQMQPNTPTAYQQMQPNTPTAYQQVQQNAQSAYQPAQMQQNAPTGYQQMTPTHDVGLAYPTGQQQQPGSMVEVPPQQVYTAYNGAPMMNQQEMQRDMRHQQYQQMDPNAGAAPAYDGSGEPNAQPGQYNQQFYKEPIFPAEPTRQPYYGAQQVRQLPRIQVPEQQAHQHQPSQRMYSNVKSTVSKTSLMGLKRTGNVPSRSQLQHIYNQYKGSQSYTQQNVRQNDRPTHSAGSINLNPHRQAPVPVPIERVAGDTINNQANNQYVNKVDHVIGRMGDVPANNKPMDNIPKEAPPTRQSKCRNGLQDVVFTSYPSSAAWSFHGNRVRA